MAQPAPITPDRDPGLSWRDRQRRGRSVRWTADDRAISAGAPPDGYDLDLDGFETDHISLGDTILFRNPYIGLRLNDEEIAISTMLTAMAAWCGGEGAAPYPLADGCQDHLVALAIEESVSSGAPVTTSVEAWAADSAL